MKKIDSKFVGHTAKLKTGEPPGNAHQRRKARRAAKPKVKTNDS